MEHSFLDYKGSKYWTCKEHIPTCSGLYVVFLKNTENIPQDWQADLKREDKLLYIGKGESGLRNRLNSHFSCTSSSSDTFKKSLGAVLINHLNLQPLKVGGKFKFNSKSEEKLSEWIQFNCTYNFIKVKKVEVRSSEIHLIYKHTPPINIDCNPKALIKLEEARSAISRAIRNS